MKEGLTEIVCVLDRSGSMGSLKADTISKFNEFIQGQRSVPGEALISVVLFDDRFETLHASVPIAKLPDLTDEEYFVRGLTRLNDALGKTINEVGDRLNQMPEEERPEKVIFMVITDGDENDSKEFPGEEGRKKIKATVEHQTEKYGWGFLFLGANIDAIQTGQGYGVNINMCANFGHTSKGLGSAYTASGSRVRSMRCTPAANYVSLHNLDDDTEK